METTEEVDEDEDYWKLFKSYYVVWKLSRYEEKNKRNGSLNRTMQYGNECERLFSRVDGASLNRTMQYGNRFSSSDITEKKKV